MYHQPGSRIPEGRTKSSYDNIDDSVIANEVAIKRHNIVTNTLDWHLSLVISHVDELT